MHLDEAVVPGPDGLLGRLSQLEELVDVLCAQDPSMVGGSLAVEASRRLVAVLDRLTAQRLGLLGTIEAEGAWATETMRSFPHWLARAERRGISVARKEARTAVALRDHLLATARAVRGGAVAAPLAEVFAVTLPTSEAREEALRREVRSDGEALLGEHWESLGQEDRLQQAGPPGRTQGVGRGAPTLPTDPGHERGCPADLGVCTCERGAVTGEQVLLGLARRFDHGAAVKAARRFAHVSDPDADDRGYREAREREHLDVARTTGGYHLSGFLTELHGQTLRAALETVTGAPRADDGLRPGQRRAIALAGMAQTVLDGPGGRPCGLLGDAEGSPDGPGGSADGPERRRRAEPREPSGAARPRITVLVPWRDFHALARECVGGAGSPGAAHSSGAAHPTGAVHPASAADSSGDPSAPCGTGAPEDAAGLAADLLSPGATWLDGTGPVPREVLRAIAADCDVTRVVFGPSGGILDVGRSRRTFTGTLRRAVVARDRACVWPGCAAPPQVSQIHHAKVHWADGGPTSHDNAALLCWFHHALVDRRRIAMEWRGEWFFSAPGGYDRPWTIEPPEPMARSA